MPPNSSDFMYSLLTTMTVGVILTSSFASYVNLLTQVSEANQLKQILNRVASKATGAVTAVTENNSTVSVVIRLPLKIGNRDYWIRCANDSSKAWVEGAFGTLPRTEEQECRVYLPGKVSATGTFEGRYELAQLDCSSDGSTSEIILGRRE